MQFPKNIQKAVDLGLLRAEDGKIVSVGHEEAESVLGLVRLMEKIQPKLNEIRNRDEETEQRMHEEALANDPHYRDLYERLEAKAAEDDDDESDD